MTAATRAGAQALLGAFLSADAHYRASAASYGDGGEAALARALDLFAARPELGFVWVGRTADGGVVGGCVVCYAISTSRGAVVARGEQPSPQDWLAQKSWCLQQLAWGGLPQIELVDDDGEGRGELVLVHHHDGRDLQLARAQDTLRNLAALWRRPVQLMTIVEKQGKKLLAKNDEVVVLDTVEAEARCAPGEKPQPGHGGRREAS
jgi:hypothetical protein